MRRRHDLKARGIPLAECALERSRGNSVVPVLQLAHNQKTMRVVHGLRLKQHATACCSAQLSFIFCGIRERWVRMRKRRSHVDDKRAATQLAEAKNNTPLKMHWGD
jgi:hypothetical protein